MRAPRELRRRRLHRMRTRAELLTHSPTTHRQSNLPEIGQKIADTATRVGGAERFAEPAGHTSIEVDLAVMGPDDARRRDLELAVLTPAQAHHPTTRSWLRTVPGIGELRRRVRLDELHDIHRCPRGQDCVFYGRVVTCAKASAGKRDGTGGRQIGHASLTWAFSEAAVRFLRDHPLGQPDLTRWEKQHGTGKALPLLAQHLARAVSCRFKRHTAFALTKFRKG